MLGSIELGGTKIICALEDKGQIIRKERFETEDPATNVKEIGEFFKRGQTDRIGIGMFGPLDLNPQSEKYGYVLKSPKLARQDYDFLGNLKKELKAKIYLTTDVNEAALGEYKRGAGLGRSSLLYMTVGTGIGCGMIYGGKFLQGVSHPEMGHIEIVRNKEDKVESVCPIHKNCLEGLAAGPSIEKRCGKKAEYVDISDKAFDYAAEYIAKALITYTLILRPEVIVIGGGLINKEGMIEKIREKFLELKTNYFEIDDVNKYIVKPALGNDSGIIGGFELAKEIPM